MGFYVTKIISFYLTRKVFAKTSAKKCKLQNYEEKAMGTSLLKVSDYVIGTFWLVFLIEE